MIYNLYDIIALTVESENTNGGVTMFCRKCGANVQEGEKFCSVCGTAAGISGSVSSETGTQPQYSGAYSYQASPVRPSSSGPNMGRKNLIIIAAVALLVIVGVFLMVKALSPEKPSDVVKKFANSINKKDVGTMLSCVSPEKVSEFDADALSGLMSNNVNINITQVVSEVINGDDAFVIAQAFILGEDNNGGGQVKFALKKIGGSWKIDDMNTN